ncbi:MbtH family protein [Streptomyces qinglanensis]|uniref:MbtH family protein n=1 Tax=Streptomyces qinglanensis TaxID=943816 RepID=UPI0009A06F1D|nr:MbtH family protein [Streptomyces qinglanensis]
MHVSEDLSRNYVVVHNEEEQYSIWSADRTPPDGWRTTDFRGSKQECLEHIEKVWVDMRPLSTRAPRDGVAHA